MRGVIAGGVRRPAGAVLVAAGPWTPELVDTACGARSGPSGEWWWSSSWVPRRAVLEQADVKAVHSGEPGSLFSLVAGDGACSLGSTFLTTEPDPATWVERLLEAGTRFVPGLRDARVVGSRAARPQSFDGRPLVGEVLGIEGCGGSGARSLRHLGRPATARLAAPDALLGGDEELPPELAAAFALGGEHPGHDSWEDRV